MAALLSLAGCGGSPEKAPDAAARPNEIRWADKRDPNTLDPALMRDAYDGVAGAWVHQGLTRFGAGTQVEPALAESWDVAKDGLSVLFHLRKDAKFHDGSPVTAWDVEYSVARVLDPAVGSQRRWMFEPYLAGWDKVAEGTAKAYAEQMKASKDDFAGTAKGQGDAPMETPRGVEGVVVEGPREVRFRFAKPFPPFLKMMAMPNAAIAPLGSAEKLESEGKSLSLNPIGAGPWRLESWSPGERLVFVPFADYWEGPPAAKMLTYRAIANEATWREEFEAGNVDFYLVSAADHRAWRNKPEKQALMKRVPELNIYFLGFNAKKPALADKRVRRALGLGLNVAEIFEFVALERGELARGPVPPQIEGSAADELPVDAYDPDHAKALLAQAGAAGLELSLYYTVDSFNAELAQNVQADWEKIGVKTTLKPLDRAALAEARSKGEHDVYLGSWWADYPDAENFLYPLFHADNAGTSNNTFYDNPEVNRLIDAARFNPDPVERTRQLRQAERRIVEDAPMIFLWHRASFMAAQPWIEGYVPHPMLNGLDFHEVRAK